MNPLNREWFYSGFRKKLRIVLPMEKAEEIWESAGKEYASILQKRPGLKQHKGAMVIPAVSLYRVLKDQGEDAETLLNSYGETMGIRFAKIIHVLTSIPELTDWSGGMSKQSWKK